MATELYGGSGHDSISISVEAEIYPLFLFASGASGNDAIDVRVQGDDLYGSHTTLLGGAGSDIISADLRQSPRTADEIIDVLLELELDPAQLRAEIEVYHGETFEPLNGWGADIIRADDEVVATAIGFSSRGAIRTALLDAGIRSVVFLD